MFSAAFSGAFAGRGLGGYIGPVSAQAALTDGAEWVVDGASLVVDGAVLIGPAGKTFSFASEQSAARWVDNARNIGTRERSLIASIAPEAAALWKARKREKLAVIADRVLSAAARMADAEKRAALVAESAFCSAKWG